MRYTRRALLGLGVVMAMPTTRVQAAGTGVKAWGQVRADGVLLGGANIHQILRLARGYYRVTMLEPAGEHYAVVANPRVQAYRCSTEILNSGTFDVKVNTYEPGQVLGDDYFSFVVVA